MLTINLRSQFGWLCLSLALGIGFGWGSQAYGNLVYVFSGVGSGTLGQQTFTSAPFSITAQGDPTQVSTPVFGVHRLDGVAAVLEIAGLGSANFAFAANISVNQNFQNNNPSVGISDPGQNRGIFFVGDPLLANYDLRSTFSIPSGRALYNSSIGFDTTLGRLVILDATAASFTAVPEPNVLTGWWLLAAAVASYRRRRRQPHLAYLSSNR